MKLYRRLKKKKRSHRSVLDNQIADVQRVERECPLDVKAETKENIIRCVVCKMVTL